MVWKDDQERSGKPSAKQSFFRAGALFELGKLEEGRRLVHRGLDQLVSGNRESRWIYGGNSGFVTWPGMDCYVRYERCRDEALKERYRKIYTGAFFYKRLSTSNHIPPISCGSPACWPCPASSSLNHSCGRGRPGPRDLRGRYFPETAISRLSIFGGVFPPTSIRYVKGRAVTSFRTVFGSP